MLPPMGEIERYVALPTNSIISGRWATLYDGVSRANDVLKTLEEVKNDLSVEDYNEIAGQARFLRAFFHFRLQKTFFQIPYIKHDIEDPESVPNDHPVWDEIEADLQFAIDNLPASFPGEPGRATKWAALATMSYVHLFQSEYTEAKPLLDQIIGSGQFALVDSFYHNFTSFTENNIESIFEIQYAVNTGATRGYNGASDSWLTLPRNQYLPTCCGFYQPSQDLVNAFKVDANGLPLLGIGGPKFDDSNLGNDMGIASNEAFVPPTDLLDPRLDWTVGRRGIPYLDWGIHTGQEWIRDQANGGPYNTIKQMYYMSEQATAADATWVRSTAINFRAIRYAHVLLWRAECAVEENDLETARQLVNQVRARASDDFVMGRVSNTTFASGDPVIVDWSQPSANYLLGQYPSFPTQEYARAAVRMEERLEFGMEGNRFFDLRRWGADNEVLNDFIQKDSQFRTYMQGAVYDPERNDYWPLPQDEIDIQKGTLIQDPSY